MTANMPQDGNALDDRGHWQQPDPGSQAPLNGMRVLDLSQQLPGPYATFLLAGLGASVIKVEPPGGDAARHLDPEMFDNVNSGKISCVLDLKQQWARDRLYDLASEADVFVEGYRPGVTRRLGCDYDTLRRVRPQLVYCSISGFGQEGPLASHPTHDISLQALAGALPQNMRLDRIGVPWVDLATATNAALTIVAAWHRGDGGYIDFSMFDTALAWAGVKPQAIQALEPTYGTVATGDGGQVVIAILEDAMWTRLCRALDWADWENDSALSSYTGRQGQAARIRRRLDSALGALTRAEITDLAAKHDLPIEDFDGPHPEVEKQVRLRAHNVNRPRHPSNPAPAPWQSHLVPAPQLNSGG